MPPPGLLLRAHAPGDLPELQRIRAAAFRPVFRFFAEIVGNAIAEIAFARADEEQAELLDRLCAEGSGSTVLVAELRGAALGFVSFTTDAATRIGEIGLNAVRPDMAGQGIGTAMYEHVLARMKDAGMSVATVGVGGDPSHAPARRAYEKAGFGAALPSLWLYRLL
jgi:GNAT superfamily N-acetyltransferase